VQSRADELLADTLPLTVGQRQAGFGELLWVQSGLAIGTWSLLIGGITAAYVGFWDGLWAMLFGGFIGTIPMMLATALPANKWGAEHYVVQRGIYGALGVKILIVPTTLMGVGWIAILATMLSEYTVKIAGHFAPQQAQSSSILASCTSIVSLVACGLVVIRGEKAVARLNRLSAPSLIVVCGFLIWKIFTHGSTVTLASTHALTTQPSRAHGVMLALELNVACGMSWWSLAANVSRSAKTSRIVGYVPVAVLAQVIGLLSAHTLRSWDPPQWGVDTWHPVEQGVLLVFVWIANVTSIAAVAYSSTLTVVQHFGVRLQRSGWKRVSTLILAVSGAVVLLFGVQFYQAFFTFTAWTQALLAPAIGITLVDYYLLRKGELDLASLYNLDSQGAYFFWRRTNWVALTGVLVGAAVYVTMLNPVTLSSATAFDYVTASGPSLLAAAMVHLLLTRLIVVRAGKGGY